MRNFPRTARRRALAAMVAGGAVLSLTAVPMAQADDLKDKKHHVQGRIQDTRQELDQSSDRLVRASRSLDRAQHKLSLAETHLSKTRGQLAAAEALDDQMQAELNEAIDELRRAREELAAGRSKIGQQEDLLGQLAVQNYQSGSPSLLGLSMVLTSQDPAELTSQLNSVKNVLDKESVVLDRLKAQKILLAVQEEEVQAARDAVAARRKAAAENLERKKALETEAQKAEARVTELVDDREDARRAAAAAKAEDLRRLHQLEKERNRISAMLERRAERARARAQARAQAQAAESAGSSQDSGGFLSYPVNGYITSPYGMRMHPVYHRWTLHDGTDFGVGCGTPVHAAASGTVISMYFNEGYGNRVIIDHGYQRGVGLGTAYNHLSGYSTYVGEHVQRGEVIGYVGTTGYSTGCHLHFMVFENGATVNPMGWL